MKAKELTVQTKQRKSPEELEALKAAPDYWKKEVRNEFNTIIKRFGATSTESAGASNDVNKLSFDRNIVVPTTDENNITLSRDKRARALLHAIASRDC